MAADSDAFHSPKRYLIEAISRACDVLEAFRTDGEALPLREIASRAGLSKSTAFRILFTLERRGLVQQSEDRTYRLLLRPLKRRKYRLGYGAQSTEFAFSRTVSESIQRVAFEEDIDLVVLNNRYNAKTAVRNAELFVREHVDLVIEFQTDEHCAPIISSKFHEAQIPFIAIDIPHPGATYYGANNYRAGLLGGRYLAKWALQHWGGKVDEIILLALPIAGALPHSRLTGTLAALREALPRFNDSQVISLDGNGQFEQSLEVMRKHLRKSKSRRVLVGAVNDPSAIGTLRAFEEAGRLDACAIMGQNASAEVRAEIRSPNSRLIGSVAYFPERYGESVIPLAMDILQGKPTPPAVFVRHQLVTRDTINHIYPDEPETLRA
ncbi:MAG TPA: substrate-binding domain-containing protein [Bryobacteraceae bacterium]|jgi:ribose transport system substrate-binding protein|nr:substrate-binding domain-containing protein [Bryobacteraceae bacterium]